MAVGDVVNGISAVATLIDFQPAAGVEVMITEAGSTTGGGTARPAMYDGTLISYLEVSVVTFRGKMFINNTRYLRVNPGIAGESGHYSGIQIK